MTFQFGGQRPRTEPHQPGLFLFFNKLKLSEDLSTPNGYCFSYEFLISEYMVNRMSHKFRYPILEFGILVFEKDYM